jgi:hypothetical protein
MAVPRENVLVALHAISETQAAVERFNNGESNLFDALATFREILSRFIATGISLPEDGSAQAT